MRLILALCLLAGPAYADDPIEIGTEGGWQLLPGLTTGGGWRDDGGSGFVGLELSLNRLSHGFWAGLYADGFYEFGYDEGFATVGPQLGYMLLGVDGGVAFRTDDTSDIGYAARAMLALAFVDIYGRALIFEDDVQWQIGLLLKMPLWASE